MKVSVLFRNLQESEIQLKLAEGKKGNVLTHITEV